jgi:hypothetical protein
MMRNPFLARKHFETIVQPMMVSAMKSFYELAKDSDCVPYHVKSPGDFFADQFPEKMVRANVIPAIQPNSEFPNPVFSALRLSKVLNRLFHRLLAKRSPAPILLKKLSDQIRKVASLFRISPLRKINRACNFWLLKMELTMQSRGLKGIFTQILSAAEALL